MAITRNNPGTIYLGGPRTEENTHAAAEVLTPGMFVELDNVSGTIRWKKAAAAGPSKSFVTEASMQNRGINDTYAIGDLVEVSIGAPGTTVYAIVPSDAALEAGDILEHDGNGQLVERTSGIGIARAIENQGAGATRLRVEVL